MGNQRLQWVGDVCSQDFSLEDGTLCRARSPVPGVVNARGLCGLDLSNWPAQDKLIEAARRTAPYLPEESRKEFLGLFTPQNLSILAGVLTVWVGSHAFGAGEAIDLLLLGVGAVMVGRQLAVVVDNLASYASIASNAKDECDLDRAAQHLARALAIIGVTVFVALVVKMGRKLSGQGKPGAPPPQKSSPPSAPAPPPPAAAPPPTRSLFQATGKTVNPNRLRLPAERNAWNIMESQGRRPRQIRQVLESGTDFKPRTFRSGEKLKGFVSSAKPQKSQHSAYWVDEATYDGLKAKHFKNGKWDSRGLKADMALPCVNSADAVVETTVTKNHLGVESRVLPAKDKVYTLNPDGSVTRSTLDMKGGALQVTPASDSIGPIVPGK